MTSKFKAGDRVRCINPGGQRGLVRGQEYTVKGTDAYGLLTTMENYTGREFRFELVPTPTFKPGDKVRIVRKGTSKEPGFQNAWISTMDTQVGTGRVLTVRDVSQTGVRFEEGNLGGPIGCAYPPSSLELVTEPQASPAPAWPGPIDLKSLKKGDKVTFSVTAEVMDEADEDGEVWAYAPGIGRFYLQSTKTYVGTVEKAVIPFAVGDAVKTLQGTPGEIMAISGDRAWVKLQPHGGNSIRELANLRRA